MSARGDDGLTEAFFEPRVEVLRQCRGALGREVRRIDQGRPECFPARLHAELTGWSGSDADERQRYFVALTARSIGLTSGGSAHGVPWSVHAPTVRQGEFRGQQFDKAGLGVGRGHWRERIWRPRLQPFFGWRSGMPTISFRGRERYKRGPFAGTFERPLREKPCPTMKTRTFRPRIRCR